MKEIAQGRLPWLEHFDGNFRKTVKTLANCTNTISAQSLVSLACHDLTVDNLIKFDQVLNKIDTRIDGPQLTRMKLALLMQGTSDYVAPAIRASAVRHGILPNLYVPDYGQGLVELMDSNSALRRFNPEAILIAESSQSLGLNKVTMSEAEASARVSDALSKLRAMIQSAHDANIFTVILQTIPIPGDPWCGNLDRRVTGSVASQIALFNSGLMQLAEETSAILFDVDAVARLVGWSVWFDASLWYRAKVPFSLDLVPLYADKFAHILRGLKGKTGKCLVLDLDNTCWGGVVGDDGLEGIQIGQGTAQGEAFLSVQHYALSLKARGVVLAVCSKNEESNAKLPFKQHPDMALRLEDISVFVANWADKATNLAHISKILNIGTDALVFLDDNPAERARVRQELPQVSVPEVSDDPSLYPSMLAHAGYFETLGLSEDDAKRADQYRANAQRTVAMEAIGNYDDYLKSLQMVCHISPFDEIGKTRITQLINKSNQFNLTTRRYSEGDVTVMQNNPDLFTLQVRLADKFGDNGMISVVILRAQTIDGVPAWVFDTWLMSCRVLKRRVEEAILAAVANAATAAEVTHLYGDYLPSPKNSMVEKHYEGLGFVDDGPLEDGGRRWKLDLRTFVAPDLPFERVVSQYLPGEGLDALKPDPQMTEMRL